MNALDWTVVAAGLATIAWINWYFFLAGREAVDALATNGVQQVPVVVHGGYQPADIRVRAGVPVRLLFERRETSSCSQEVVVPDLGITRFLPAGRTTAVEFVPPGPGTLEFTCGMGMLRGRITVEPAETR